MKNLTKTSTNISNIVKQVKKEHFIKVILWSSTIFLFLFWLAMVLATSIDDFIRIYTYNESEIKYISDLDELLRYKIGDNVGQYRMFASDKPEFKLMIKEITNIRANNPMLLLGSKETMGWFIALLTSPIGFILLLWYISWQKNMITPQAIKKTVRKALQFNYLKQKDVEYVCDELDINIGIKEREKKDEEKELV